MLLLQLDLFSQTSRERPPLPPNATESPKKFGCQLLLIYFILYKCWIAYSFWKAQDGKRIYLGCQDNHREMQYWETQSLLDIIRKLYPGLLECQAPGNCIHQDHCRLLTTICGAGMHTWAWNSHVVLGEDDLKNQKGFLSLLSTHSWSTI